MRVRRTRAKEVSECNWERFFLMMSSTRIPMYRSKAMCIMPRKTCDSGVKKNVTVDYAQFILIPFSVNDDCANCGQIQNLRDDEHDVSDHARIGQKEQGCQEPKAIGPDAYSSRAVFLYQVSNLGNVSCRNYTSTHKPQDLRQPHKYLQSRRTLLSGRYLRGHSTFHVWQLRCKPVLRDDAILDAATRTCCTSKTPPY